MLRYRRPGGSKTERRFIQKYIVPTGAQPDKYGNYILRIGTAPVLWSCHTDTVHRAPGGQNIVINKDVIELSKKSDSNCLGADCTTGVWIMLEMIKAKVEGLYIFHRDEEIGGKGSRFIASKTPEVLDGIKFAIAFDRFGKESVITRQSGSKCASQDFVNSIVPMLPGTYRADPGGTFTDTASYTDIISECSNLSVGYFAQHTKAETQSISHLFKLRDAMVNFDSSKLVASRDPKVKEVYSWGNGYHNQGGYTSHYPVGSKGVYAEDGTTIDVWDTPFPSSRYSSSRMTMERLIRLYPAEIADILESEGYDVGELWDQVLNYRY